MCHRAPQLYTHPSVSVCLYVFLSPNLCVLLIHIYLGNSCSILCACSVLRFLCNVRSWKIFLIGTCIIKNSEINYHHLYLWTLFPFSPTGITMTSFKLIIKRLAVFRNITFKTQSGEEQSFWKNLNKSFFPLIFNISICTFLFLLCY